MSVAACTKPEMNIQRPDVKQKTLELLRVVADFKNKLGLFRDGIFQSLLKQTPIPTPRRDQANSVAKSLDGLIDLLSGNRLYAYYDPSELLEIYASGVLVVSSEEYGWENDGFKELSAYVEANQDVKGAYEATVRAYEETLAALVYYRRPCVAGPDYTADFGRIWDWRNPLEAISILFSCRSSSEKDDKESSEKNGEASSALVLGGLDEEKKALVYEMHDQERSSIKVASTLSLMYDDKSLERALRATEEARDALELALRLRSTYSDLTQRRLRLIPRRVSKP